MSDQQSNNSSLPNQDAPAPENGRQGTTDFSTGSTTQGGSNFGQGSHQLGGESFRQGDASNSGANYENESGDLEASEKGTAKDGRSATADTDTVSITTGGGNNAMSSGREQNNVEQGNEHAQQERGHDIAGGDRQDTTSNLDADMHLGKD